jgi:hypothetical protein
MRSNVQARADCGEPVIVHAQVPDTSMSDAQWSSALRSQLAASIAEDVMVEMRVARAGNAYLILVPRKRDEGAAHEAARAIIAEPERYGLLSAASTRRLQDSPKRGSTLWAARR